MKKLWDNITESEVKKAIELFDKSDETYPEPRNTFLIYNDRKYPAKHIRGLAYFVSNKKEISKNDFNGGQETAIFFQKLGFTVQYKKDTILPKSTKTKTDSVKTLEKGKTTTKKLNVVSQKNALQRLFQKHFGHIETEKKFDWLKTPDHNNLPIEYKEIVAALSKYRNQKGFQKSNYQLLCDIVLDEKRLIFEYDENQHFTKARRITLENYPIQLKLHYSKQSWITACDKIKAKDNSPIDRDEKRAYYDTVRDIEAYKQGYTLIRIKHGDIDWEAEGAEKHLKNLFTNTGSKIQTGKHKIARLIVTSKHYNKDNNPNYIKLQNVIDKFISTVYNKQHFEFILTPGGFLTFEFPENLNYDIDIEKAEKKQISLFQLKANKVITDFFNNLPKLTLQKLQEIADYFTIGIDGFNPTNFQSIELVAIYDLKKEKVIKWTGKFYPTEGQKRDLVKINDLSTHFIELNNQNIVILGCHDLNVFSPRGQAVANPEGWRRKVADNFKNLCKKFKPVIVLQHPHSTFSPKIWTLGWTGLIKELPSVKHFASGINYRKVKESDVLRPLEKVLEKTKMGDVIDFYFA